MVCQVFELRGIQLVRVQGGGGDANRGCEGVSLKFTNSLAAEVCLVGHEWLKTVNKAQYYTRT